jgi:peptide chain release factor 2
LFSLTPFHPFGGVFDLKGKQERLQEIEAQLSRPGAWDTPDALTPVLQEKTQLQEELEKWTQLEQSKINVQEWLELTEEEPVDENLEVLEDEIDQLENRLRLAEMETLLSGPHDNAAAIIDIHPGAGGTDSQDWAEMLLRMYRRWAETKGFKLEFLNYIPGDEAGVKSVTLQITGPHAYGLLKGEKGIHRLIRISPFDTSGRRHTSFASLDVCPQVGQDIEIEIKEDDLRIDIFRSSGPGGQHVNKTSSAVRITHLPTNIVVQCQSERSQLKNRETCMKILRSRLYEQELEKLERAKQAEYDSKTAISWGSQIRTYTLHPYRLVKDHRTNFEISNVDAVLDGDIDGLIQSYLLFLHENS